MCIYKCEWYSARCSSVSTSPPYVGLFSWIWVSFDGSESLSMDNICLFWHDLLHEWYSERCSWLKECAVGEVFGICLLWFFFLHENAYLREWLARGWCTCICINLYIQYIIYICIYTHTHMFTYIYRYMYMFMSCVYMCVRVCICMYICIYKYTYIYIYI